MYDSEKDSNSLPPAVAPSKHGGLLLIDDNGQRIHVPHSAVGDFIDDMLNVRGRQLERQIAQHTRSSHDSE